LRFIPLADLFSASQGQPRISLSAGEKRPPVRVAINAGHTLLAILPGKKRYLNACAGKSLRCTLLEVLTYTS